MKTTRLINPCDVDENYKAYPLWCWWKLQGLPLVILREIYKACSFPKNHKGLDLQLFR